MTIFGDNHDTPDGTCVPDYIRVTDLAEAHVLALEKTADSRRIRCLQRRYGGWPLGTTSDPDRRTRDWAECTARYWATTRWRPGRPSSEFRKAEADAWMEANVYRYGGHHCDCVGIRE